MNSAKRSNNLKLRAKILQSIRMFFQQHDFLEVETPLLLAANAPEEYINPVAAGSHYLQTSPELCMKRLLCRGHERIFQISHCWRQSERGRHHLPEFTMLEWYRSNCDYRQLMEDCQELLNHLAPLCSPATAEYFASPITTLTVHEAFSRYGETTVHDALLNDTFDEIMATRIEPTLIRTPLILMDYPAEKGALARLKQDQPACAERFELYAGGIELANAFSELNDPEEQRRRFDAANQVRLTQGEQRLPMPDKFLSELATLPPSAGIAFGIDRLVMLLAGAANLDEVVAFTPEEL